MHRHTARSLNQEMKGGRERERERVKERETERERERERKRERDSRCLSLSRAVSFSLSLSFFRGIDTLTASSQNWEYIHFTRELSLSLLGSISHSLKESTETRQGA